MIKRIIKNLIAITASILLLLCDIWVIKIACEANIILGIFSGVLLILVYIADVRWFNEFRKG